MSPTQLRTHRRAPATDLVLQEMLANTAASAGGAPPLPRAPSPLSRRFQQLCAAVVGGVFADEDVAQLEYGSLIYLEIEPGIDQRRLSEAMGMDPSKTSLTVDRLHSMGLIERRVSGLDRRAHELYLTPKGKAVWRRIYPKTKEANARVLSPLTPAERKQFLNLLVRVLEGNRSFIGRGPRKGPPRVSQS